MARTKVVKGGNLVQLIEKALTNSNEQQFLYQYSLLHNAATNNALQKANKPNPENKRTFTINDLASRWLGIEKEFLKIDNIKALVWKKFITEIGELGNNIDAFRTDMDKLLKEVCALQVGTCEVLCLSSGSDAITSDIDVTVKGNCIVENFIHLKVLHDILSKVFAKSNLFANSQGVDLSKIFIFFDVNFYLSNFGIKYNDKYDSKFMSSYILSNDMSKQITYAIDGNTSFGGPSENYEQLVYQLGILRNKIGQSPPKEEDANKFVDIISKIAAQEDECYITQGAFFHVVMLLQQGQSFDDMVDYNDVWNGMMICSAVENIKFAVSHPSSRGKYIIRVFDAIQRMKQASFARMTYNAYNNQVYDYNDDFNVNANTQKYGGGLSYNNPLFQQQSQTDAYEDFKSISGGLYDIIDVYQRNAKDDAISFIHKGLNTEAEMLKHKTTITNKDTLKAILTPIKEEYEKTKKTLTQKLLDIDPEGTLFGELSRVVINAAKPFSAKYQYVGGKMSFKKLLKDGKVVKKSILGRDRVIYVNSKRKQFYKSKGEFKSVSSLQRKKP